MAKTRATYMTAEKARYARENLQKYDWARAEVEEKYLRLARKYVDRLDDLYDLVVGEGIPRGSCVGAEGDPEMYHCRYCGCDIGAKYGVYSWKVDPLNEPWKVICPDCGRRFPSNDFAGFYKLGLDDAGRFDRTRALTKNAELVAAGEPGYLVNLLYPEMGEGWGVDDGMGYVTGRVYPNGVAERHTYIACYLHFGLWYSFDLSPAWYTGAIMEALITCGYAYFYTGDIRCGRVTAVLLDRIADFYPDYNIEPYGKDVWNSHGGTQLGKILGHIWESFNARDFARCYDMVFDVYEDPFVVEYLRKKSTIWKMAPKNTPADIRKNIEDRLLRTILSGLVDCSIAGNFGYPQAANAMAAVVLDDDVDTPKWLDYLMAPGWSRSAPPSLGGGIGEVLTDTIDADGQGDEGSGYNVAWHTMLIDIADILAGCDRYPAADLYKNPKFRQMFYANLPLMSEGYSAQIGDSSCLQGPYQWMRPQVARLGWRTFGDPVFAQVLYLLNGNTTAGLHDDITSPDPEALARDVQAVIDRYGPYKYPSGLLTAFGYGALRDSGRDVWMYFGTNSGHGHRDTLNLGMTAFGLNILPELGYPEKTGTQPNRLQWVSSTLSHNTVMVDGVEQTRETEVRGKVLRFEDGDAVKVMDVRAPYVYPQCREYRRTVVMVRAGEDVSYTLDFFRVTGGFNHLLSIHAAADTLGGTEGLDLVPQADENGRFIGSYAGPDVPYGEDPVSPQEWFYGTKYPRGYTWTENVLREDHLGAQAALDFPIRDFRGRFGAPDDIHLRVTTLNSTQDGMTLAVVDGHPPAVEANRDVKCLKYVFVKREGTDLDTVFTTVYEPYQGERFLRAVTELTVPHPARAVKVEHASGRTDYVVYSPARMPVTLRDGDVVIAHTGVLGVYSFENGEITRHVIGDRPITGVVADFTRVPAEENFLLITPDAPVTDADLAAMAGRVVVVDNGPMTRGGAYRIVSASREGAQLRLDIGRVTLIRRRDGDGYAYNVAVGETVEV